MQIEIESTLNKGRGVFASSPIKKGDIHLSECILMKESQMPPRSIKSPIWLYVFNGYNNGEYLLSLDWTSLMNHDENYNLVYEPTPNNKVEFRAIRDINPGEELLINYGYDVVEHNKEFGFEVQDWNDVTIGQQEPKIKKDMLNKQRRNLTVVPLQKIKEALFDAPNEVKESFNEIVNYFDKEIEFSIVYIEDKDRFYILPTNKAKEVEKKALGNFIMNYKSTNLKQIKDYMKKNDFTQTGPNEYKGT